MHDESFRSRTNVEKRIAANQCEFILAMIFQCTDFMGINDFERIYLVVISSRS